MGSAGSPGVGAFSKIFWLPAGELKDVSHVSLKASERQVAALVTPTFASSTFVGSTRKILSSI